MHALHRFMLYKVCQQQTAAPCLQQKRRPARVRNSKRLRRSHSSEDDSSSSDEASESEDSAPRRRVSNATRHQGKSLANGGGVEDGQRPLQQAALAPPHREYPPRLPT